jgi:hypothetical protein
LFDTVAKSGNRVSLPGFGLKTIFFSSGHVYIPVLFFKVLNYFACIITHATISYAHLSWFTMSYLLGNPLSIPYIGLP